MTAQAAGSGARRPRLLLVGPVPAPNGGVSVHIERLARRLRGRLEVDLVDESPQRKAGVYNLRSLDPAGYLRRVLRADVVHVHSGLVWLRAAHVLAARLLRRTVVVTLHARPTGGVRGRRAQRLLLGLAHRVIVVDPAIAAELGLSRFLTQPAFLPPAMEREPALPQPLSRRLDAWRRGAIAVIAASAFRLDVLDGVDVYGVDLCIELVRLLRHEQGRAVALVLAMACDESGSARMARYQQRIRQAGIEDAFAVFYRDVSFPRLIEACDLVVRPSSTDGDAVSVREALWLGTPVVASDAVARPAGTRLFRSRDARDLARAVGEVLDAPRPRRERAGAAQCDAFYLRAYGGETLAQEAGWTS